MATQQLYHQVLQKYGWSASFYRNDNGYWCVTVTMGFDAKARIRRRTFCSDYYYNNRKEGMRAASQVALRRLQGNISNEERKLKIDLVQAFEDIDLDILDSDDPWTWQHFWNHPPSCVGIDVEGNQTYPPVLVQIATDDFCILEVPWNGQFSDDLQRLLKSKSIRKIFCDHTHRDKYSLDLASHDGWVTSSQNGGKIIDLEILANKHLGHVKVPRGLGNIASLCMVQLLDVRIVKPKHFRDVARFAMIEQHKLPRLEGVYELTDAQKRYAALDAWVTLQCYNEFCAMGCT